MAIPPGSTLPDPMLKNINWKNVGTIFVVAALAIVTAPLWLPPVKSLLTKLPVIGPKLA